MNGIIASGPGFHGSPIVKLRILFGICIKVEENQELRLSLILTGKGKHTIMDTEHITPVELSLILEPEFFYWESFCPDSVNLPGGRV